MCSLPCTPRPPVSYSSDGCLRRSLLPDARRLKLKSLAHFPGFAIHLPLNPMRDPYAEKMGSWRRIRKHIMVCHLHLNLLLRFSPVQGTHLRNAYEHCPSVPGVSVSIISLDSALI